MIVGGAIGGVAVLALLSGIIAWTWTHHNRRNLKGHDIHQAVQTGQNHPREDVIPNRVYEGNALSPRAELDDTLRVELDSESIAELGHSRTPHIR